MKKLVMRNELDKAVVGGLCLFNKAKVGAHLAMVIDEGKSNSIAIAITHSESVSNVTTVKCEFSSISTNAPIADGTIRKCESRALLTIIDNKIIQSKNMKTLKLMYSTGLHQKSEQEYLKDKVLFMSKANFVSDKYNNRDSYILYQKKYSNELVRINDQERLIQLVGISRYERYFEPLSQLVEGFDERRLPIADILLNEIDEKGILGLMETIKKI